LERVTPFSSNHAPWLAEEVTRAESSRQQTAFSNFRNSLANFGGPWRSDTLMSFWRCHHFLAVLLCPELGILSRHCIVFDGCLKRHPTRKLGFDPAHPAINKKRFQQCDWTEFCSNASSEAIPENMPKPMGKHMSRTRCFVDANHADNARTRRFQTGILLHATARRSFGSAGGRELSGSTFGLEFTVMKNALR
jgi:hypothetical protein